MTPEIALTLFGLVAGGYWTLAKLLMGQTIRQLDARFEAQDEARTKTQEHWELRFAQIEILARNGEKDLLLFRGDLPNIYVRRDDYIRGQSLIESKLDGIASKFDLAQIKGGKN